MEILVKNLGSWVRFEIVIEAPAIGKLQEIFNEIVWRRCSSGSALKSALPVITTKMNNRDIAFVRKTVYQTLEFLSSMNFCYESRLLASAPCSYRL